MDVDRAHEEAQKVVEGLTSLDPVEYDAVINQYFEANATIDNSFLRIQGASQIKKFVALQAHVVKSSEITGEAKYDDSNQTVHFTFKRALKNPPILPALPIVGSLFAGDKLWYPCGATLHLNADEESEATDQGQGKKLLVTRLSVTEPPVLPLVGERLYTFLRPFLSLLVVAISTASAFYYRHGHDSWFAFVFAAIADTYNGIWQILANERSKREAQANKWKEAKGEDYRKLLEQAKTSAAGLQSNLEAQAKARGIPVDQYKKQAESALKEVAQKVNVATHYFEEGADSAKAQVKENVEGVADEAHAAKESVKQDLGATVDDLSNRIDSTFDTETHKPEAGDDADDDKDVHAPGGDHDDSLNADEGRPRTPLGGHDPTAPEAFSYAQAVKD